MGGNNSSATGINKSGQVVGGSDTASGTGDPFIWQNGVMTDLLTLIPPNYNLGSKGGINDSGQIAADNGGNYTGTAYLLNPSTTNTFGPVLYVTWALAMNSAGQIAGISRGYATLWQNGTVTNLAGNPNSGGEAFGINNATQVVGGISSNQGKYAFLWQNGKATNLNSLIPSNSGWSLTYAIGINDPTSTLPSGSIIGFGTYNGSTHMFLAIDPPRGGANQADVTMVLTPQNRDNNQWDFLSAGYKAQVTARPGSMAGGRHLSPTISNIEPADPDRISAQTVFSTASKKDVTLISDDTSVVDVIFGDSIATTLGVLWGHGNH